VAADGDKATVKLKLGSQNPETVVMGPRFVNLFILSGHAGTECIWVRLRRESVTEVRADI
jgi:hypothetical protein